MRILYGVVGEGMGHATRSAVVLEHLESSGHEIKVVVSGRAHRFLEERFRGRAKVAIEEIHGLTLRYFGNELDRAGSLYENLKRAPSAVRKSVEIYRKVVEEDFRPQIVVSDFESWAALYARTHRVPVISIDNIQSLNRLEHDKSIRESKRFDFDLARLAVKMKVPGAYHYLVTSFFFPKVRKKFTTLVPPILRPEVLEAAREPADHVVLYHRAVTVEELASMVEGLPYEFRIYGAESGASRGNVLLRPFSGKDFLDDLRTARAVIGGAGFSLMSEAVTLGVPMLAVPIDGQYEQELNARYLKQLGYGSWVRELGRDAITGFLDRRGEFSGALARYEKHDNGMLFTCLDELLELAEKGTRRPKRLSSPSMGSYPRGRP